MKGNAKYILLVFVILAVLIIPFFEVTVVPNWKLQVINQQGQPLPNQPMIQGWKDYSLEFWTGGDNSEEEITDKNGYVIFPERTIRVSIGQFILAKIRDIVFSINPHASFGKHAYIICGKYVNCIVSYREGKELPKVVVAPS